MKIRSDSDRLVGNKISSKQDQLVGLLRRKSGARTDVLVSKLGWQRHTVRAAISRLRARGHSIDVKRGGGGPTYSIVDEPSIVAQAASSDLA